MDEKEIRELFRTHGVALNEKDVWAVQGTPVVKHNALERLAAKLGVAWDMPVVLRAERDEAVFLVRGSRRDGITDWSTGEAQVVKEGQPGGNYKVSGKQASYVYAMAEKRARDRVILKLAGLHGAYSEEEADDFRQPSAAGPTIIERGEAVEKAILAARTPEELEKLWHTLADDMKAIFRARFSKIGAELKRKAA